MKRHRQARAFCPTKQKWFDQQTILSSPGSVTVLEEVTISCPLCGESHTYRYDSTVDEDFVLDA
jgi:hypothetical protein